MNCADYLEAMLDAEPAELRGRGTSALAEHLRGCLPCGRAAAAIVADTRVLARAIAPTVNPHAWRRRAAIAGLAAAGVVLALATRSASTRDARSSDEHPFAPTPSRVAAAQPVASPDGAAPSAPRTIAVAHAGSHERPTPHRIRAVPIRAAAFVAEPIRTTDSASFADRPPVVSVRPQGGRRAVVFRVAASNVTVVWLY